MIKRRETRTVNIGGINIGSGYPISMQSMTTTDTSNVADTISQINMLDKAGCEIVRVAVKDMEDARAIGDIKSDISIPLVADIHFDHRLAIEAIKQGVDKIRINPGNMTSGDHVDTVVEAAIDNGKAIRIGLNSGSINSNGNDISDVMVGKALEYIDRAEKKGFKDLVVSLKTSEVESTVKAYKMISEMTDCPLHLGVTASGLEKDALVASSIGIGSLLLFGIGDTFRVSITGDPKKEIEAAKKILSSLAIRQFGPKIIACPTCGRCQVDLVPMAEELEEKLSNLSVENEKVRNSSIQVAIMGCEVNGPGEAKSADIGVAFGKGKGVVFADGKIVKTVDSENAVDELVAMLKERVKAKA
jgi:(E)-4-hydroxy-3-methylbut-2-enyl-diphosphate synthase